MTQLQKIKIQKEILDLKQQVRWLSSLLISVAGQDKEGVYKPAFVKNIKNSSSEDADSTFSSPAKFLSELQEV